MFSTLFSICVLLIRNNYPITFVHVCMCQSVYATVFETLSVFFEGKLQHRREINLLFLMM